MWYNTRINSDKPISQEMQDDINSAARSHEMFISDGWRCDFCESNCTCDEDDLRLKVEEIALKYPKSGWTLLEIENAIWDKAHGYS